MEISLSKELPLNELINIFEDQETKYILKVEKFKYLKIENAENTQLIRIENLPGMNKMSFDFMKEFYNMLNKVYPEKLKIIIGESTNKFFCIGADLLAFYIGRDDLSNFQAFGHLSNYIFYKSPKIFENNTVVFWNGVTMGGGLAIGVYSEYRVATETTVLAMPEAKFGFFTNCFFNNFISKYVSRNEAIHMAFFCHNFRSYEVVLKGFANYFILNKHLDSVLKELKNNPQSVKGILMSYHERSLTEYSDQIKNYVKIIKEYNEMIKLLYNFDYDPQNFLDFYEHIKYNVSEINTKLYQELMSRSILSLMHNYKIACSAYENLPFEVLYDLDCKAARETCMSGNLFEGIRAYFVDKDKKPKWSAKF
jgi:enoyl-CoA hydratase/carnithine racemase